jgi:hypothetical protein
MTLTMIPDGTAIIVSYVKFLLTNDDKYDDEDKAWLAKVILNLIDYLDRNIYYFLTIINVKCFSGYFSKIFNDVLYNCVKSRDTEKAIQHISNLRFPEIDDNKSLTEEEVKTLRLLFDIDVLATNLTIKRFSVNTYLYDNLGKAFEESYANIYISLYVNKTDIHRSNFEDFVVLMEENGETGIKYAHTFSLYDILVHYIFNRYNQDISQENIDKIKDTYYMELKMVQYFLDNKDN